MIRKLHYQLPPKAQAKYVRVIKGKILDVVVDIRKQSKNFMACFDRTFIEKPKADIYTKKGCTWICCFK